MPDQQRIMLANLLESRLQTQPSIPNTQRLQQKVKNRIIEYIMDDESDEIGIWMVENIITNYGGEDIPLPDPENIVEFADYFAQRMWCSGFEIFSDLRKTMKYFKRRVRLL